MILVTTSTAAMLPARLTLPVTKKLMMNVSMVPTVRQLTAFINERPCPSRPRNRLSGVSIWDWISPARRGLGAERLGTKRICENSPLTRMKFYIDIANAAQTENISFTIEVGLETSSQTSALRRNVHSGG